MNWEAISTIGQIVGALAVVVSLIYLATEVRSSAHATREATMRSVSDRYTRLIHELSGHPELRDLYYRGIRDLDSLKGADLVGFSAVMVEAFRLYEEIYYRQSEGQLGPRLWRGFEASMRDLDGYPGIQAWWRLRSYWFSEQFAKHVDQLQQTATPPRMYREPMEDE